MLALPLTLLITATRIHVSAWVQEPGNCKAANGDDRWAHPVTAVAMLKHLGVLSPDALTELSPMPIKNRRGDVVGRVESTVS